MIEKLNVKVGDNVIFTNSMGIDSVAIVEKITPKGFIKVNGFLFTEDGSERSGDVWGRCCIRQATTELIQQVEQMNFRQYILKKLHSLKNITYEQSVEVNKILEENTQQY